MKLLPVAPVHDLICIEVETQLVSRLAWNWSTSEFCVGRIPFHSTDIPNKHVLTNLKVQVQIILRPTVSRSVCLGDRHSQSSS
jgi:hypothetical protein